MADITHLLLEPQLQPWPNIEDAGETMKLLMRKSNLYLEGELQEVHKQISELDINKHVNPEVPGAWMQSSFTKRAWEEAMASGPPVAYGQIPYKTPYRGRTDRNRGRATWRNFLEVCTFDKDGKVELLDHAKMILFDFIEYGKDKMPQYQIEDDGVSPPFQRVKICPIAYMLGIAVHDSMVEDMSSDENSSIIYEFKKPKTAKDDRKNSMIIAIWQDILPNPSRRFEKIIFTNSKRGDVAKRRWILLF